MKRLTLEFKKPLYYNLRSTCQSHGWVNLAPFKYDGKRNILNFALNVTNQSYDIFVEEVDSKIITTIISEDDYNEKEKNKIKNAVIRILDLRTDTSQLLRKAEKFGEEYVTLIKNGAGRLLRSSTLWEDAAKTLFTTNCSWALTKKMCEAACSKEFVRKTPYGIYPFPDSRAFLEFSSNEIRSLIPLGYRADYFLSLSKIFSKYTVINEIENGEFTFEEAYKQINSLKGFGEYATSHLLILTGYFNKIPIDTVVTSYLKRNYSFRKTQSFIDRHYGKWGDYKWWGLKLEKMLKKQNWLGN